MEVFWVCDWFYVDGAAACVLLCGGHGCGWETDLRVTNGYIFRRNWATVALSTPYVRQVGESSRGSWPKSVGCKVGRIM
jgi:hypothetical protein